MRMPHGRPHRGVVDFETTGFYIVFVGIGEAIAYAAGRTVELWSPATSLPVFLGGFFFVLWAAWRLAVKMP